MTLIRVAAIRPLLVVALFAHAAAAEDSRTSGILQQHSFSAGSSRQWKLPDKLNEISGLAVTEEGRVLAITDEAAIVYELDYTDGALVKAFALGEPTARGDFEGLAYSDGRVWLITSNGVILESSEGADGERSAYDEFRTGLDEFCEFEGLAFRPGDRHLLLLCKNIRKKSGIGGLAIFAWSTTTRSVEKEKTISLPDREIAAALRLDRLNPSGIAIEPRSGNLLIVAARQRALVELSPDGAFMAALVLPLAARHRQAEGIAILGSGAIVLADEGGEHKARLAIYRPMHGLTDGRTMGSHIR